MQLQLQRLASQRNPNMSMTHEAAVLNPELHNSLAVLQAIVQQAAHDGTPLHEVELSVWQQVLRIGRLALGSFFAALGDGDMGETITLPDGSPLQRLPELHDRPYVSVFGKFVIQRTVYGSREGQKIEFVPLDNRLQLPEGIFSYLLQDWDQSLCAEQAFGQVNDTIARILGLKQSVDSLEHMNQQMAEAATPYRLSRPVPPAAKEGELFVASADGKGIVMRRQADDPAPSAYRSKGEKASCKRMATVGAVYSVDRYIRTPEEVLGALFRDEVEQKPPARPQPQHKHVWASLPQEDATKVTGMEAIYVWMMWELCRRNPQQQKETVYLYDGQEALWKEGREYLPQKNSVGVLDLLHVTPRLWQAAHLFHREGSAEAEAFARERILRVLKGEVLLVVRGLRVMGTKHGLKGNKKKNLEKICGYLERNAERMAYDRYLAAGYPIASGVIEGACRHVVKDRMERAGMHWTREGAEAMLEVRSLFVSGCWEAFQTFRIKQETKRLYPHRDLVEGSLFMMAI
jgi:hypothetical protein